MTIPSNNEAEMAVLGAMIGSPETNHMKVLDLKIAGEHFYDPQNRMIFECVVDIGETCDLITLGNELVKLAQLEAAGGYEYLEGCIDECIVAHVEYHCEILVDMLHRRKMITAARDVIEKCSTDGDVNKAASEVAEAAYGIFDVQPTIDKAQIVTDSLQLFDNAHAGIVSGVPLPWDTFSKSVGGIQRRCVCPLMGRDGVGKSFLVAKILHYLGMRGIPALSIPFEDGADRQMRRIAGCNGKYSTGEIERGIIKRTDGCWSKMDDYTFAKRRKLAEDCLLKVSQLPIYFEDATMTVEQVRAVASRYKRKHDIQIMFVDGVKDVVPSKGDNGTKQEEHISRVLVQTAKELDIAIVPVSHLTDIQDDILIHRRNLRGAKSQFQNARQVLIYQNSGLESGSYLLGDNSIALHMEKNNYGNEAMQYLDTDFDHCDFLETKPFGYK